MHDTIEDGKCANFRFRASIRNWMTQEATEALIENIVASILRPCGKNKRVHIYRNADDTCSVQFLPKEQGTHVLKLLRSNQHVLGSPFEFNVTERVTGGHDKVVAYGPGLTNLTVNEEATFDIVTSEAGEGKLDVSIHGPSKADITYSDMKDGTGRLSYTITDPGKYNIHIKFDGNHIPGSPFEAEARGFGRIPGPADLPNKPQSFPCYDVGSLEATGEGLYLGEFGKKAIFRVNCPESGTNSLIIGIVGPSGPCEDIVLKKLNCKTFEVVYIPEETGEFVVVIKWGDEDINGSPFRVMIS